MSSGKDLEMIKMKDSEEESRLQEKLVDSGPPNQEALKVSIKISISFLSERLYF
ncbi:unnamed protein product [Soboliphyme baturini]|uniref:CTNNB1_binding domain-containing protein n=1 Tax=Soboliphyme baturini TaxID=241478 RepID=A0A183IN42_9BILA|nr:unnamed protein product [Soboliphyme baturini]